MAGEFDFLLDSSVQTEEALVRQLDEDMGEEPDEFDVDKTRPIAKGEQHGHTPPLEAMTDPKKLIRFMNSTRRMPVEAIDDYIVNRTYAVAVWQFRSKAIQGDYTATRALEIFLKWAAPILKRPKRKQKDGTSGKASAAFGPREPQNEPGGTDAPGD